MRNAKRLASLLLALVLVFAMMIPVFAAETTGTITINNAPNVSVAGKTFNAYKILDVKSYTDAKTEGDTTTPATVVYTVPSAMKSFYMSRYSLTGDEGDFDAQVVEKISAEENMFAFAAAALAAAKSAGITSATATAGTADTSVTISNLPLGYYVIEDDATTKPVSALVLDTTNPNIVATIKADQPSIDKKIDADNDKVYDVDDVKNNNSAVGDMVPYVLHSTVPDMTGYTKYYFVVTDTLSKGLTFNSDVAITVGTKTLANTDFTVTSNTVNGETVVEIVFKNFIQYKDAAYKNADITITYSATVNENAVIGTAGNPNEVKLTYSNNPNITDAGEQGNPDKPTGSSPVGKTPESITYTYVTGIELIKVDPEGNRLTGAEFTITGEKLNTVLVRKDVYTANGEGTYWKLKDGSYTTTDPTTSGVDKDKYESITDKYAKTVETTAIEKAENVTYTGTVGADGVLRFEGLSAGTYTITEIKAPAGYNLLKDPINITIGWTAPKDADMNCEWTATGATIVDGIAQLKIENNAGTELPSTGGMGTTIFYVLGSVLVLAAVVLLVTKKRMNRG